MNNLTVISLFDDMLGENRPIADRVQKLFLPHDYSADSVSDFDMNKRKIRPQMVHLLHPGAKNPYHAGIYLGETTLKQKVELGEVYYACDRFGRRADVFVISDRTGAAEVLWPEIPYSEISLRSIPGFSSETELSANWIYLSYHMLTDTAIIKSMELKGHEEGLEHMLP